ncbi:MAG: nicotinamide mononucleotide transporter [Eubacterium sp.]|nr:nicotinamide mononucleotide transporter [Eubacterium sp.]
MRLSNPFKTLTRFELCLWIFSVIAVTVCFLLSSENPLTLVASLIGVTALIFVAKGYVAGQVLTVIFSVFYGIISFFFAYYGEMITYLGMTAPIAVASVVSWLRHPYENSAEVEVGSLDLRKKIIMVVSAALVTGGFYFILGALGTANLLFSTLSVTTSFTASYLTVMRSPFYAVAYAGNDIVLIILWSLASMENIGYLPMTACFAVFLINDIYGFVNWRRMRKRQTAEK